MTNEETKCESLMIGGMSGHWLCEEKGCLQVGKEYCELCKEYKHLEKENAELSNLVTELTNSKTELENKVTELNKQIEKMKMVASSWIMSLEDVRASEVNNRRFEVLRELEKRVERAK